MDTVTPAKRSEIMSKIRSRSRLEDRARPILEKLFGSPLIYQPKRNEIDGLLFNPKRGHHKAPFQPDFYEPKTGTVIYVHGCFWHGCAKHYREPKSNVTFWKEKVENNQAHDGMAFYFYLQRGYNVYVVWEHSFKGVA